MYAETKNEWSMNHTLSAEVMRPIEERIAKEKPALSGSIAKLRELLPTEVFERSFAKVENLSKSGDARKACYRKRGYHPQPSQRHHLGQQDQHSSSCR